MKITHIYPTHLEKKKILNLSIFIEISSIQSVTDPFKTISLAVVELNILVHRQILSRFQFSSDGGTELSAPDQPMFGSRNIFIYW